MLLLRGRTWAIALLAGLALAAPERAAAQYGYTYPGGYGGWGGWGASTPFGDAARGMGMFAAGVGQYNVNTAQAAAINSQTIMQFNEYLWESQQVRNQRYYRQQQQKRKQINMSNDQIYARLRDNPDTADINSGDALNVALSEITRPKVYIESLREAQSPIPSAMIREIPFNVASEAVTMSLDELTDRDAWPAELTENPAFERERAALRAAAQELRKEDDEGDVKPETLKRLRDAIAALRTKVEAAYPRNTPQRTKVDPYLKGITGLARMLQQPKTRDLLRNVDQKEERPLSDLIGFMHTFNLRFGVAETPDQQAAYAQLFPLLDGLRDQVNKEAGPMTISADAPRGRAGRATQFFQGMPDEHLNEDRAIPSVPQYRPGDTPKAPAPRRDATTKGAAQP